MKPLSIPKASFSTLATGARQLVVHDAFETTTWSSVSLSWLTPCTTVRSAFSAGAETRTRLASAFRCAEAFSFEVKMPVHSRTTSTPSSPQGSFEGSRSAKTLKALPSTVMVSPSTRISPGKRPCTLS